MKRALLLLLTLPLACSGPPAAPARNYVPDLKAAFSPLPLGAIRPEGWLKRQLEIQAAGLSGHIEGIWKDLGPDNGWRGGNGEGWERGPYYLDGLIPLAFLLQDPVLLNRMQGWIDWNLEHQRPDGAIGPDRQRDWWPDMVMWKAMAQYGEASGDSRVGPFLERYAAYVKANLKARPLDGWRKHRRYDEVMRGDEELVGPSDRWQYYRWFELSLDLLRLYQKNGDRELLALAREAASQGYDWETHFNKFRFTDKSPKNLIRLATHGVNNAMALKAGGLLWLMEGKPGQREFGRRAYEALHKHHGQPNGAFSCDEHLAGLNPSQGTETCTVVEELFSLETLAWINGEAWTGDAIEALAFNALPAAMDEAMWTRQYDQQVNQVLVSEAWRDFTSNQLKANVFGLETEWGCCTANFHQGWPKYAASLWMSTPDGGLACQSLAPCSLSLQLATGLFGVEVQGSYPFEGEVRVVLHPSRPVTLPLKFRIPAWAEHASIRVAGATRSAAAGTWVELTREWKDGDSVELNLPLRNRAVASNGGLSIRRGAVLMALDLEPELELKGGEKWSDRWLSTKTPWAVAPLLRPGEEIPESALQKSAASGSVFDRAQTPWRLKLKVQEVGNWHFENNSAGMLPPVPALRGETREAILIPYGAAKLRVAVFPIKNP